MDQGRGNDTLRAIDALVADGVEGPEIDYLYGMAFVRRGHEHMSQGANDVSVRINFEDACELLPRALAADADRFDDAWLSLARATWELKRFEEARLAIEEAAEVDPGSPAVRLLEGRIARSQFLEQRPEGALGPDPWPAAARSHWDRGLRAYRQVLELCGTPRGKGASDVFARSLLVAGAVELGGLLVEGGKYEEATAAFALAVGWDSGGLDLGRIHGQLTLRDGEPVEGGNERFRSVIHDGSALRAERGSDPADDPALLWWRGWTDYVAGDVEAAEREFLASVEAQPDYTSSWYYVSRLRDARGDLAGARDALIRAWEADPTATLPLVERDRADVLPRLDGWIAELAAAGSWPEAAILAEVLAEAARSDARHWNNLGFFLREAGRSTSDPDVSIPVFEASLAAYEKAIALDPNDPQLVNDAAVVLELDLKRDLTRALDLYERAGALAARRLTEGLLPEEERERFRGAADNARRNQERLRAALED